jgi:hypothetical protein
MTKGIFLTVALSLGLVGAAMAAPTMTGKGPMSLTFEANPDSPVILFGWNIADMTKFNIGAGFVNNEPGQLEIDGQPAGSMDSSTSWQFQTGVNRYLGSISNNMFAPYIGAQVNLYDRGSASLSDENGTIAGDYDTSFAVRGYFGVEAFVVESLSIGGNIGLEWNQEGDWQGNDNGTPITYKGDSSFSTGTSSILATLYW